MPKYGARGNRDLQSLPQLPTSETNDLDQEAGNPIRRDQSMHSEKYMHNNLRGNA